MRTSRRAGLAPAAFEITAMLQIAVRRSRSHTLVLQAGTRPALRVNMLLVRMIELSMNAKSKRRATTTGILFGTRVQAGIDSWREEQDYLPARPIAVRRLVVMKNDVTPVFMVPTQHANQS